MPDSDTLSELFARDPFSYTKEDIDRIIEEMAARRKTFLTTGKAAPKADKAPVDLADLGLL